MDPDQVSIINKDRTFAKLTLPNMLPGSFKAARADLPRKRDSMEYGDIKNYVSIFWLPAAHRCK